MPIRLENKHRYPDDWPEISRRICFGRALGRCECQGECGYDHFYKHGHRCRAVHGLPHPITGSEVVLTAAHLDHIPEHCGDDNLKAMCQRCHLSYDRHAHALQRWLSLQDERQLDLFEPGFPRWFLPIADNDSTMGIRRRTRP